MNDTSGLDSTQLELIIFSEDMRQDEGKDQYNIDDVGRSPQVVDVDRLRISPSSISLKPIVFS